MPARHIDSIHDRYELQPTPRCQSSTSLSCSFTSGGWREGWGAEEPGGGGGGGRRVLNFIILPRGGGAASCCCCSPAAGTHRATSDSGPQLSSWAKLTLERVLFHPLSSAQLWHFSSLDWLTLLRNKNPPSSLQDSVALCFHVQMWVWVKVHRCSFVFILVCSQQRAVWAGPSCIPGSDSRPPPGRSSPASPLAPMFS